MGATPVCQITSAGCVRPDLTACLGYIQGAYRSIYGADVYLGADSQDGQFMALLAQAIHDCNGQTLAVYNAYSPATAQGEGLSSVVKVNGIRRKAATYSTCDFLLVGQVGAPIVAGVVRDPNGYDWLLPDVTIPSAGQIFVTGTCQVLGAITLPANAVDTENSKGGIATPQLGWQTARNPSAAAPGQPVETDSQLRQRQAYSVALPAQTLLESMIGALSALPGTTRIKAYENDTPAPDRNGIPGHSLALVVDGGNVNSIAAILGAKKGAGVGTYGSTLVTLTDAYGIPHPIRFSRPVAEPVAWYVQVRPKAGYTVDVANAIKAALVAYTNGIDIGGNQERAKAYSAANLSGTAFGNTFEIVDLAARRANQSVDAYGDIQAKFDGALTARVEDVDIVIVDP